MQDNKRNHIMLKKIVKFILKMAIIFTWSWKDEFLKLILSLFISFRIIQLLFKIFLIKQFSLILKRVKLSVHNARNQSRTEKELTNCIEWSNYSSVIG